MTADCKREYAKQRRKGLPAATALAIARMYTKEYGWEPVSGSYDRWTREVDGFQVELSAVTESTYAKDGEGMGHYVRTRQSYVGHDNPDLDEETPLGLPASHFIYATASRDVYQAFFPDNVEEQYEWARTQGGMSRGVARDWVTEWVSTLVRECCSEDYVYLDLKVTVRRSGITLGTDTLGDCDFIDVRDADVFAMVEDHGMVEEAIDSAISALEALRV
jgi:hypothetical protein